MILLLRMPFGAKSIWGLSNNCTQKLLRWLNGLQDDNHPSCNLKSNLYFLSPTEIAINQQCPSRPNVIAHSHSTADASTVRLVKISGLFTIISFSQMRFCLSLFQTAKDDWIWELQRNWVDIRTLRPRPTLKAIIEDQWWSCTIEYHYLLKCVKISYLNAI